jgi:hypothetical protein
MIGCPPPWQPHTTGPLADLLADFTYQPGWTFTLWHLEGETVLAIDHDTVDTNQPDTPRTIGHRFARFTEPADRPTARRWLLDRIIDVHTHEACEWFTEGDTRPYDPHHNYRQHAYQIHDWTTP